MRLPDLFPGLRNGKEKREAAFLRDRPSGNRMLPQKVKYGPKHSKIAIFFNNTDKLHKNGLGSLGNIALESGV